MRLPKQLTQKKMGIFHCERLAEKGWQEKHQFSQSGSAWRWCYPHVHCLPRRHSDGQEDARSFPSPQKGGNCHLQKWQCWALRIPSEGLCIFPSSQKYLRRYTLKKVKEKEKGSPWGGVAMGGATEGRRGWFCHPFHLTSQGICPGTHLDMLLSGGVVQGVIWGVILDSFLRFLIGQSGGQRGRRVVLRIFPYHTKKSCSTIRRLVHLGVGWDSIFLWAVPVFRGKWFSMGDSSKMASPHLQSEVFQSE